MNLKLIFLVIASLRIRNLHGSPTQIDPFTRRSNLEQCIDFECLNIKKSKYFTTCGLGLICKNCPLNSFKSHQNLCNTWKEPHYEFLVLNSGSLSTKTKVGNQFFHKISTQWIKKDPVDISNCKLENFKYDKTYQIFSTGQISNLYTTITFQIIIVSNSRKKSKPDEIEFQIELQESMEEINNRGVGFKNQRQKSFCPVTHLSEPYIYKVSGNLGEVSIITRSFSLPIDRSLIYNPDEFSINVRCRSSKICDLGVLKFCLRLFCSRMPESQYGQLQIIQNLLKIPPPNIPNYEENKDISEEMIKEDEDNIKEETETQRTQFTHKKRANTAKSFYRVPAIYSSQIQHIDEYNKWVPASNSLNSKQNIIIYILIGILLTITIICAILLFFRFR
ncbi:hypothetical protein cand_012880 [Cryptosporidium andersoni]|uniref:Uncharacterized protein n=1 Tax=Cryptosporidium andersoni TaxID=117008 RepID=A0A1J4MDL2_9CRYT|nr:hypothetical protein cand_012880 [Cryptosporidium andersoni]